MPAYVCKIIGVDNELLGVEEFARKSHVDATYHAKWLLKSAGPQVKGYELWCDGKIIGSNIPRDKTGT
jgi:hypothetical protein